MVEVLACSLLRNGKLSLDCALLTDYSVRQHRNIAGTTKTTKRWPRNSPMTDNGGKVIKFSEKRRRQKVKRASLLAYYNFFRAGEVVALINVPPGLQPQ